jgi:hypothetical protein
MPPQEELKMKRMDKEVLEKFHDCLCGVSIGDGPCSCLVSWVKGLQEEADALKASLEKFSGQGKQEAPLETRQTAALPANEPKPGQHKYPRLHKVYWLLAKELRDALEDANKDQYDVLWQMTDDVCTYLEKNGDSPPPDWPEEKA